MTHTTPRATRTPTATPDETTDKVSRAGSKPRLLFLRWPRHNLSPFIYFQLAEHVKCLSLWFDVTLVDQDCDYDEVCDRHKPDITLFESGVYVGPRKTTNTGSHSNIPKIGLFNGDSYCASRSVFISDMTRWGISTYFTISVSTAEYFPSIADDLFLWPNFVDPGIFHDYEVPKTIPVLLTGSHASWYPWRNKVRELIVPNFPTFICPHHGWFGERNTAGMLYGEPYARLISASHIAPTCGTIANEVVRKHFEIPACGSCLVTEPTPALLAAGFADMENCIFSDGSDIIDKLNHVLQDPELLSRITKAGHDLVHSNHTISNRDQIYKWFKLNCAKDSDQRIVQAGPFGPLSLEPTASAVKSLHLDSRAIDRAILREGYANLGKGNYRGAEICFYRSLNYRFFPEANLGLAICHLHRGKPDEALQWLEESIRFGLEHWDAPAPDPVEWAYVIVCLLCKGEVRAACARAAQFAELQHIILNHCRVVMDSLQLCSAAQSTIFASTARSQPSIHLAVDKGFEDWIQQLKAMLAACGQVALAERLREIRREAPCDEKTRPPVQRISDRRVPTPCVLPLLHKPRARKVAKWLVSIRAEWGVARAAVRWARKSGLFSAGRFIPVLRRLKRTDELCRAIAEIASKVETRSVLVLTRGHWSAYTDSLVENLRHNQSFPELLVVAGRGPGPNKVVARLACLYNPGVCIACGLGDVERLAREGELGIVLVDGPLPKDWRGIGSLLQAHTIIVRGTTTAENVRLIQDAFEGGDHALIKQNATYRDGYLILRARERAASDQPTRGLASGVDPSDRTQSRGDCTIKAWNQTADTGA